MIAELEAKGFGKRVCILKDNLINQVGEPADYLLGLISGSALRHVRNPDGKIAVLEKLRSGDLFGFEVFENLNGNNTYYCSSTKALEDCQILKIPRDEVTELMRNPSFALDIMRIQAEEYFALQKKQSILKSKPALAKLANILFEFADYDEEGNLVVNNIAMYEFGGAIGTSKEVANRQMTILRNKGLVSNQEPRLYYRKSYYMILDEDGLREIAQEKRLLRSSLPLPDKSQ